MYEYMNKSQLAKKLVVSRTYVTLLSQGKRQPGPQIVKKLSQLKLTVDKLSQLDGEASNSASVDSSKLQTR
jgi:transcriptional regulator with XRE-family HTH domain